MTREAIMNQEPIVVPSLDETIRRMKAEILSDVRKLLGQAPDSGS